MARRLVRFAFAVLAIVLAGVHSVAAATGRGQGTPGPFDGRWVIPADAWFDQLATASGQGRGGAGAGAGRGAQAPGQDVVLELRVTSTATVTGRVTGVTGRRGAPGSHPAHAVEITRGTLEGETLRFQIWRFDGFHNRLHVTARAAAGDIELEFRRETPNGPETFTTRAPRAAY